VSQPGGRRRHWGRWAIGVIAVILLIAVGGPFVYIHFIEGKAPAPLSITNQSTTSRLAGGTDSTSSAGSAGATTSVEGTWKVTSGSQAGYRVTEVLFGQNNTAVGRTSSVTGTITIAGTNVTTGSFTVDMTTVKSDRSQRDNQFQGRIMDTVSYPTATLTLTKPIALGTIPAEGATISEQSTGNLTLHGTTRAVTFQVMARRSGSTIQVSGSIPITFANWNIPSPSFGPVTTEDHGILEFLLDFVPA
jgi:polyisoprenoid-binding protein YceI